MAQVSYGAITITDITDIENIQNWYLATDLSSGVTKNNPDTGHGVWTTDIQNATLSSTFQYLWNYEKVLGTGNVEISSTQPIIIGHFGADGADGADGNSIVSIDEYYKITDSPIVTSTNPGSDNWQKNTLVVPTNSQRYLWNYQVINYSKTGSEGSYEEAHIIGIHGDTGPQGNAGINTATVYLYQRATSAPSKPNSTLTYTFSNATLSGTLGNWKQSISELTGTNPIWVIAAVASSNGATDTIASSEWSTQIKLAENGVAGLNQATIYIYKRAISVTTPGSVTYTFSNGSFSVPNGWSKTIPASNGNPCYVTSAIAIGNGSTATLTWNTPSILVEDGVSPTVTSTSNGVKIVDAEGNETYITNGTDGTSYYTHVRYSENSDGSNYVSSPTSSTIYMGVYSGTSPTAPSYNDSGWKWSRYVGNDGVSVTGTRELYYLKTNSMDVPQITSSTQITTTDRQDGWTSVIPTYITNAEYYTCIETSLNNNTKVWSAPIINNALTNANQKALDAYNTSVARDTEVNALKAQAKHYWWDSQGAHVAAGTNTTDVNNITQGTPATYGFNSLMSPSALKLRYRDVDFAQLATSSLTFYRPAFNGSAYVQGKKAMALTIDALTFYKPLAYNSAEEPAAAATLSSTGLNIVEGSITLGDNFSVDSEGSLTAIDGTIGGWSISSDSLYSLGKTDWNEDEDGIYIGKNDDNPQNIIFTISGGKIQYVSTDDTEVNQEVTYYRCVYILSTDSTVDPSKDYYIKDLNKERYVQIINPSGSPIGQQYYEKTDEYLPIENPGNESPKDMGWYKNLGPMWYINSDGSASFGSLVVNQTGILDVPAASIRGKLNADQIEVESLWAENASIGATADRGGLSNSLIVDSEYTYVLSLDTRPHPNKIYYKEHNDYIEVDSSETVVIEGKDYFENIGTVEKPIYVIVDNTDGKNPYAEGWFEFREYSQLSNTYVQNKNPYEEGWFEKTEKSHIVLESNKITYLQTEDTTIQTGQDYYEYKVSYVPTTDVTPQKNKDYYTVGAIEYILSTDTEVNVNKDYYELDDGEYKKVTPDAGDNPRSNNWYEIFIPYNLVTFVSSRSNPNSEKWYEKNISYQLVSNPTGIPKNNYWYIQSTTFNVNLTLEDAELSIKSDNNELLSINPKEEKDINISELQVTNRIKIGNLEITSYNNGIAIQPITNIEE